MNLGKLIRTNIAHANIGSCLPKEAETVLALLDNITFKSFALQAKVDVFGAEIDYAVSMDTSNFDADAYTKVGQAIVEMILTKNGVEVPSRTATAEPTHEEPIFDDSVEDGLTPEERQVELARLGVVFDKEGTATIQL